MVEQPQGVLAKRVRFFNQEKPVMSAGFVFEKEEYM